MNTSYRNKLITLSDGDQYVILSEAKYKGNLYALAHDVVDNKLGSNMTLFRLENVDGELNFIVERNLDIVGTVLSSMG